jgi:hypothetical protein
MGPYAEVDNNDTGDKFATVVNDTSGKQWEQLSDYWQFKMNLKQKKFTYMLLYLYYPKVSIRNNNTNFPGWRFFPFATGVNDTGGAPWAVKNLKRPKRYNQGLGGKSIHVENLKSKISWHCPFKAELARKQGSTNVKILF